MIGDLRFRDLAAIVPFSATYKNGLILQRRLRLIMFVGLVDQVGKWSMALNKH